MRAARVPGYRIKVAKGDTLSTLSRRYGVSVAEIMSANNLPDGRLQIGQELVMPGVSGPKPQVAESTPAPSLAAAPASGQSTYKVQKGDTPHDIADKLGVDERALIAANHLNPNNLQIGQVLVGPGPRRHTASGGERAERARLEHQSGGARGQDRDHPRARRHLSGRGRGSVGWPKTPRPRRSPAQKEAAADIAASPEITGERTPKSVNVGDLPTPDPMSGNSFRWPVRGRIIAEFGARPDGGHNDGIDVAVPQGTSVKAAENGVVAYAGNELKGYGNLVLVRHANNWVSAYANNEELLVKRGDKVRRGQIIAKAGATGAVSQPQVHFELRKGSRPVDPTKYMSDAAASAD